MNIDMKYKNIIYTNVSNSVLPSKQFVNTNYLSYRFCFQMIKKKKET